MATLRNWLIGCCIVELANSRFHTLGKNASRFYDIKCALLHKTVRMRTKARRLEG